MIWRAGGAGFRAGAQAAISVQSPDSGLILDIWSPEKLRRSGRCGFPPSRCAATA